MLGGLARPMCSHPRCHQQTAQVPLCLLGRGWAGLQPVSYATGGLPHDQPLADACARGPVRRLHSPAQGLNGHAGAARQLPRSAPEGRRQHQGGAHARLSTKRPSAQLPQWTP